MPDTPTVTKEFRQNVINFTRYDTAAELGASNLEQIHAFVQRSQDDTNWEDMGLFASSAYRRTVQDDTDSWTTPLVWSERVVHLDPPAGTWYYRYKWQRYSSGTLVSETAYSSSQSTTVGPTASSVLDLTATSTAVWKPPTRKSRLWVLGLTAGTIPSTDPDAVDQLTVSDNQLSSGPSGQIAQFMNLRSRGLSDAGYINRGPWGIFAAFDGDPDNSRQTVKYTVGARQATYPSKTATSFAHPYDCYQAGTNLGGTKGTQMQQLVTGMLDDDAYALAVSQGVPIVLYGGPPFFNEHEEKGPDLYSAGRLGLHRYLNVCPGWDVVGPTDTYDPDTLLGTGPKNAIEWMNSNFPDVPVHIEVPLRTEVDAMSWFSYPNVVSQNIFSLVFDDDEFTSSQTLVLNDGYADPNSFPNTTHVMWIDSNACGFVGAASTNQERAERMAIVAMKLKEWGPNIDWAVGSPNVLDDANDYILNVLHNISKLDADPVNPPTFNAPTGGDDPGGGSQAPVSTITSFHSSRVEHPDIEPGPRQTPRPWKGR